MSTLQGNEGDDSVNFAGDSSLSTVTDSGGSDTISVRSGGSNIGFKYSSFNSNNSLGNTASTNKYTASYTLDGYTGEVAFVNGSENGNNINYTQITGGSSEFLNGTTLTYTTNNSLQTGTGSSTASKGNFNINMSF